MEAAPETRGSGAMTSPCQAASQRGLAATVQQMPISRQPRDGRSRRAVLMALLATLMALAGFMCWAAHVPPQPWVNQDVAVNLFSGTQLLSGARLYVDWHDTNPPAIHVWSALIVGLSRWIGQSAVLTYHLSMVTVFGMSASLLIRNIGTSKPHAVAIFTLAFGGILLSPTLLRFDDFGQREQIWLILFFPLLLLRVYS